MKSFIIFSAFMALAAAQYYKAPLRSFGFTTLAPRYEKSYGLVQIPILRQASDISPDGSYSFSYETANGIAAQESGIGGHSASGGASWTAPDGTPVQLSYTADENGYQAAGSHVPQIPAAILRSIEWNKAHPQNYETYQPAVVRQYKPYRF